MKTATQPPITHGGTKRGYQTCQCQRCGTTGTCTPLNDFYTTPNDPTGPLYCFNCIVALHREKVAQAN